MSVTAAQLADVMGTYTGDYDAWTDALNSAMARFGITTALREAAFLAQVAEESQELNRLEENLSYSAARLVEVFPREFDAATAAQYAHKPEAIANRVYANKYGNGDESTGDGWRYRGRGPIQVTFADNYRDFGRAVGQPSVLLAPDQLLSPAMGALAAAWLFHMRGCNELADASNIDAVSRRINPGGAGLVARQHYFELAKGALGA